MCPGDRCARIVQHEQLRTAVLGEPVSSGEYRLIRRVGRRARDRYVDSRKRAGLEKGVRDVVAAVAHEGDMPAFEVAELFLDRQQVCERL